MGERESTHGGRAEREGERENLKQVLCCQHKPDAGLRSKNCKIMTYAETESQMLNQLSHQAPHNIYFTWQHLSLLGFELVQFPQLRMLSLSHLPGPHLLILLSSSSTPPSLGNMFWSLMSILFTALYIVPRTLPIIYTTHYSKCPFVCLRFPLDQSCQTFSVKYQTVIIAGFASWGFRRSYSIL